MQSRIGTLAQKRWSRCFASTSRLELTRDGRRLVLGIESSCDDSCASLVSAPTDYFNNKETMSGAFIHNSIVLKQDHSLTKGIEPMNAANAHSANIPLAIMNSLKSGEEKGILQEAIKPIEIDAIAVTRGPGMGSSLSQGLSNAKLLSTLWNRPLLYVHHMIAHALTPFLSADKPLRMPFLVLLLSGGHTQLVLCRSSTQLKILATSHDDSIGNTFDKVARMLQISFDWAKTSPGAALEAFANSKDSEQFKLPVPFRNKAEFSYSGLKSAVERFVPTLSSESERQSLAYAFQRAAFQQIQDKITMSLRVDGSGSTIEVMLHEKDDPIQDLVISGGVASNQYLRQVVNSTLKSIGRDDVRIHFPPIALCTDNAAMIAHAGLVNWNTTRDLTVTPRAKWSVEDVEAK